MGIAIAKSRVIVCEGESDKAFFSHLIDLRGLPEFDIFHPAQAGGVAGGVSGFGQFLTALSVPLVGKNVSGILVVADNDTDPKKSFATVRNQLAYARDSVSPGSSFGIPDAPLERAASIGLPPITILMLPWTNEPGNLETLCLDSVNASNPAIKKCLDDYCDCTKTKTWDISKLSKMQLESVIATLCRSDPATALRYAWNRQETIIPLDEPCFDRVAGILSNF